MNTDFDYLIYPIADIMDVNITATNAKLSGKKDRNLDMFKGVPMPYTVRLVDSVVDVDFKTVGAIFHIVGNLFVGLISEARGTINLFVIDGAPLNWAARVAKVGELDTLQSLHGVWSRKKFYAMIAPGVKATYKKSRYSDKWELVCTGNKEALEYVKLRKKNVRSSTALKQAHESFRVAGPRGV